MSSRENKLEKTIINAEIAYEGVVVDVYHLLYSSVKCGRHVSGSYRSETEEMTARPGDVIITSNSSSKTRGAAAPRTRITWRLP